MKSLRPSTERCTAAFTILEVLIAALLICIALGGILEMNTRSIHILRSTRQVAASSLILQQRMEMIRARPWPEISNSTALAQLMGAATDSEAELADAGCMESIKVSVAETSAAGTVDGGRYFTILRQRGTAEVQDAADFGKQSTLLFEDWVTWRDLHGVHERKLRTIICRAGLTRSGIFGSPLGRPVPRTIGGAAR